MNTRRNAVSEAVLILLLLATAISTSHIRSVDAIGTVYIRADGSVDPPASPIQRNGDIYTLTDSITGGAYGIVIERNNMTLVGADYTVQGTVGVSFTDKTNITVRETWIRGTSYGVYMLAGENNTVIDNVISSDNSGIGIFTGNSRNNTITRNNISFNDIGIYVWNSTSNYVGSNIATFNSRYGAYLYNSADNRFEGNTASNNNITGIVISDFSNDNLIIGNIVQENGQNGIHLKNNATNNLIRGNRISGHLQDPWDWRNGIIIYYGSQNNIVSANDISQNGNGIYLISAHRNVFSGNNITENVRGFGWQGNEYDNLVFHNNFLNNTIQVFNGGGKNQFDLGYPAGGNYWSDYSGVDANGDGIGDTPYYIAIYMDMKDSYPLMNQWVLQPRDVAVTAVTSSKTIVGQGDLATIKVTVENQGLNLEDVEVAVDIGSLIFASKIAHNLVLASLTFTLNTMTLPLGNQTISAYATPLPGETDTADNSFIDGAVQVTISGDVDGNGQVEIKDFALMAKSYGAIYPDLRYVANYDINSDSRIDIKDFSAAAKNFGKTKH